jgi:hypothetical protein
MRTKRQSEAMTASASRLVRTAVVLITIAAVVGCEYEPAGVAAGLTAESLGQLRRGMTRDDVLRVLGPPLSEHTGSSGHARLIYARSRSLSMGDHWITQPALDCAVLLDNDFVSEAYFSDGGGDVRCSCRRDACPDAWASECVRRWQ